MTPLPALWHVICKFVIVMLFEIKMKMTTLLARSNRKKPLFLNVGKLPLQHSAKWQRKLPKSGVWLWTGLLLNVRKKFFWAVNFDRDFAPLNSVT